MLEFLFTAYVEALVLAFELVVVLVLVMMLAWNVVLTFLFFLTIF
jgi:hypothetical protein